MTEFLDQIATIIRGMWIYRRWAMAVTWLAAVVSVTVVLLMPDHYQASARVFLDTQSILRPLMNGIAVQPNIEQQVIMLSRTLINRPTVERLVRQVDLDLGVNSKTDKDALIDAVTKAISIQSTGRDNLYTLSYRDKNPEVAQRVVQSLLTIFVESSLGASRQDSEGARRFLNEQIKSYENKLTEAEGRLKDFKLRNIQMESQTGLDAAGRAAEVANLLSQARLDLREAESARAAASHQLETMRAQSRQALFSAGTQVHTPDIDARLEVQRRNLDTLLQRYTEAHPDVQNTRRLITDLEAQKRKEIETLQRNAQNADTVPLAQASPAMLELSRAYSTAEVQVAALRARVAEYEARSQKMQQQLKLAPQLEAELAQLNRDYEINKKNYADLVARRESASISGQLENTANVADFRVIDPPRVNPKPVAPNRALLLPLTLLLALACGAGIAFVASQVRPVIFDNAGLRQLTQLPVLGVVQLLPNAQLLQRERRSLQRFMAALCALLLAYGLGFIALSYHTHVLG